VQKPLGTPWEKKTPPLTSIPKNKIGPFNSH
jgi:hypothetical protein